VATMVYRWHGNDDKVNQNVLNILVLEGKKRRIALVKVNVCLSVAFGNLE
jgi:hypothetical protein